MENLPSMLPELSLVCSKGRHIVDNITNRTDSVVVDLSPIQSV